jgi:hypothetical protein
VSIPPIILAGTDFANPDQSRLLTHGLAIVQDVLNAYGWSLDLAKSELGGLKATVAPSAAK